MHFNRKAVVFLDGKWVQAEEATVNLHSQTMHYGNGVFEGIRAYQNDAGSAVFKAREHFDRLHYSAKKMQMSIPYTTDELVNIAYELLKKNNLSDAYIRPLVYAGMNMSLTPSVESHLSISAWKWEKYFGDKPLKIGVSSFQRPHSDSCFMEGKVVGNYASSILATNEAKHMGYDEALLLDINGNVAGGSGANFFFEKNEVLFTPPPGNILLGITRATVLELAKLLDVEVREQHFTIDEVYEADHAFFAGTAAEIAPIISVNNKKMKGTWKYSVGHSLYLMYQQLTRYDQYQNLTIV